MCDHGYCSKSRLYDMDSGENHLMREMESQNRNSDTAFGTIFRSKCFQGSKQKLNIYFSLQQDSFKI
jgi:hypothetical protein